MFFFQINIPMPSPLTWSKIQSLYVDLHNMVLSISLWSSLLVAPFWLYWPLCISSHTLMHNLPSKLQHLFHLQNSFYHKYTRLIPVSTAVQITSVKHFLATIIKFLFSFYFSLYTFHYLAYYIFYLFIYYLSLFYRVWTSFSCVNYYASRHSVNIC